MLSSILCTYNFIFLRLCEYGSCFKVIQVAYNSVSVRLSGQEGGLIVLHDTIISLMGVFWKSSKITIVA